MLFFISGTATCTWNLFMVRSLSGLQGAAASAAGLGRRARGPGLRPASGRAVHAVAGAAIVGEIAEQRVHPRVAGRVVDVAPILACGDEPRVGQLLQVEREGRGRNAKRRSNLAHG